MSRLVLLLIGSVSGASCYRPTLRDCTVTCEAANDCATGQVCGADGFCAAPAMAGRCSGEPAVDAVVAPVVDGEPLDGSPEHDPVDARVPQDAPRHVDAPRPDAPPPKGTLHLHIDGHGDITGPPPIDCASDCVYTVDAGTITLTATPGNHQRFEHWTGACSGANPQCTLAIAPLATADVHAKFVHGDDH